jgi:DNA-directed RNA polymerase delta subunit
LVNGDGKFIALCERKWFFRDILQEQWGLGVEFQSELKRHGSGMIRAD